jgi:hypothetical protein
MDREAPVITSLSLQKTPPCPRDLREFRGVPIYGQLLNQLIQNARIDGTMFCGLA